MEFVFLHPKVLCKAACIVAEQHIKHITVIIYPEQTFIWNSSAGSERHLHLYNSLFIRIDLLSSSLFSQPLSFRLSFTHSGIRRPYL